VKRLMRRFTKQFRHGEKGFTLVELLVVIAIIGVIAAVVVPNVGQFMGRGKTEAYAAELNNVRTATIAMMADSDAGVLDGVVAATDDMDLVLADSGAKKLSEYISGLNTDGTVKSGCTYAFTAQGVVTQESTP